MVKGLISGRCCHAVGWSTIQGVNEEVYLATMLLVKPIFICKIVSVYPTTCACGMDECGMSRMSGMDTLYYSASTTKTDLFIVNLC